MATLADVREGLAANLSAIPGCQVSAYMLANPTPPTIHLFPADINYDQTMGRGHDQWMFTVQAFVGSVSDIGSQKKLDEMLAPAGASSVKAAIESDLTLGGTADDLRVTTCSGYRELRREGGGPVLLAEWSVEVLVSGT